MTALKYYRLAEYPTVEECKQLGEFPRRHRSNSNIRAVSTDDHRPPRKGEWYLSGATPLAWRAPNDLPVPTPYRILRLVNTEVLMSRRITKYGVTSKGLI